MLACPHCGWHLEESPELAGRQVACPTCGGAFWMPAFVAVAQRVVPRGRQTSGVAAVLSFFIPGAGQIFNGDIGRGLAFFFAFLLLAITVVGALFVWLASIIDAYDGPRRR